MSIDKLIDKQDSFEIVRDQIAMILVNEVVSQMALATAASKDPNDWKLRIFTERSNPWEQFLDDDSVLADDSPIVNIWYSTSNFPENAGSTVERQKTVAIYNIDCYGYGVSKDDGATGHDSGDKVAAFEVQRALRLVRNILMAGTYTYLELRGLVWQRWPQSIEVFQPQIENQNVSQVVGARISFRVTFNEFSPQVPFETLELVTLDVFRTETGELIAETDYAYPLTP